MYADSIKVQGATLSTHDCVCVDKVDSLSVSVAILTPESSGSQVIAVYFTSSTRKHVLHA